MSLENQEIAFILLITAILILLGLCLYLLKKVQNLVAGGLGKNIPETLKAVGERLKKADEFEAETIKYLSLVEKRLRRSTQAIGVVRFNAFGDYGSGGQSFAISILNENGDGIVISSLYGRERVSVYSKPVTKFSSDFELTTEEKNAVKEAREKLNLK